MDIANALITCIILMSILVGLLGSFFLKKYISQMYKIKHHPELMIWDIHVKNMGTKKGPDKSGPFHMLFKKY